MRLVVAVGALAATFVLVLAFLAYRDDRAVIAPADFEAFDAPSPDPERTAVTNAGGALPPVHHAVMREPGREDAQGPTTLSTAVVTLGSPLDAAAFSGGRDSSSERVLLGLPVDADAGEPRNQSIGPVVSLGEALDADAIARAAERSTNVVALGEPLDVRDSPYWGGEDTGALMVELGESLNADSPRED